MNLRDIAQWDTRALQAVQRSLSERAAAIAFVQDGLADIGRLPVGRTRLRTLHVGGSGSPRMN
ncbi:hypothetical protein P3H15_21760 [Rhodococcus sp. T2V]|nr:hypothetical protein [Rhodococcus sp. T2V]MDF3307658.1 hypothetical protein [Rhodococcus sp. T2V]